jgi:hypothetical protein
VARDRAGRSQKEHLCALPPDPKSYAGKLVTGLGKGGGVSVTVRADHASIEGLIRYGKR